VSVVPGTWVQVPGAALEGRRQQLWRIIGNAQGVREVDRDPLNTPAAAIHLAFTLPPAAVPGETQPWKVIQGEIWIGQVDHRVQAAKLFAQAPYLETTERLWLGGWNTPITADQFQPAPQ
jgi:hypothetical protein